MISWSGSVAAVMSAIAALASRALMHEPAIIEQAIEGMPSGPILGKVPRVIQPPEGEVYVRTENSLGELGYYLISDGHNKPYRMKLRSPSFCNLSALKQMTVGHYVADAISKVLGLGVLQRVVAVGGLDEHARTLLDIARAGVADERLYEILTAPRGMTRGDGPRRLVDLLAEGRDPRAFRGLQAHALAEIVVAALPVAVDAGGVGHFLHVVEAAALGGVDPKQKRQAAIEMRCCVRVRRAWTVLGSPDDSVVNANNWIAVHGPTVDLHTRVWDGTAFRESEAPRVLVKVRHVHQTSGLIDDRGRHR